jgi:hypothetical protein
MGSPGILTQHNGQGLDHSIVHEKLEILGRPKLWSTLRHRLKKGRSMGGWKKSGLGGLVLVNRVSC